MEQVELKVFLEKLKNPILFYKPGTFLGYAEHLGGYENKYDMFPIDRKRLYLKSYRKLLMIDSIGNYFLIDRVRNKLSRNYISELINNFRGKYDLEVIIEEEKTITVEDLKKYVMQYIERQGYYYKSGVSLSLTAFNKLINEKNKYSDIIKLFTYNFSKQNRREK